MHWTTGLRGRVGNFGALRARCTARVSEAEHCAAAAAVLLAAEVLVESVLVEAIFVELTLLLLVMAARGENWK